MKLSKRKNPPASEESVMKCQNASSLSCGGSVSSAARTLRAAANANNNNATAAMRRCLLIRVNILVTARVQSLFDPSPKGGLPSEQACFPPELPNSAKDIQRRGVNKGERRWVGWVP